MLLLNDKNYCKLLLKMLYNLLTPPNFANNIMRIVFL